jgi:hypothetical protein
LVFSRQDGPRTIALYSIGISQSTDILPVVSGRFPFCLSEIDGSHRVSSGDASATHARTRSR